jgi:hypothetical protein
MHFLSNSSVRSTSLSVAVSFVCSVIVFISLVYLDVTFMAGCGSVTYRAILWKIVWTSCQQNCKAKVLTKVSSITWPLLIKCVPPVWWVFVFIKKTTSYGTEKMYLLYIFPPWAPHTYDFVVLTSLTHPRKIGCAANRKIGKAKDLSAPLRTPVILKGMFLKLKMAAEHFSETLLAHAQTIRIGWYRTDQSSGKAVDLYLGYVRFESRPRHRLSLLRFFVSFPSLSRIIPG